MNTVRLSRVGACISACLLATSVAAAAPFQSGNLIVVEVDGSFGGATANVVYLHEYTTFGGLVQTIPLPTLVAGSQRRLTLPLVLPDGFLTQSADGQYFLLAGYDAPPGTAGLSNSNSGAFNRVIARIGLNGTIDTSTAMNDAYSGNGSSIRSAASNDGLRFWTAGTAAATTSAGVRYQILGPPPPPPPGSSAQLSTSVFATNVVNIFNGQLYVSHSSGTFQGVSTVGTGLPTTSGQTITPLPGFPASGLSSADFYFYNPCTLYVADSRALPNGGIQKWTLSAATWSLAYTMNAGLPTGLRGLTASPFSAPPQLFATTSDGSALVTVTDGGPGSPFTAIAFPDGVFKGVRLNVPPSPLTCLSVCNSTGGLYGEHITCPAPVTLNCVPPSGSTAVVSVTVSGVAPCDAPGPTETVQWYVDNVFVRQDTQAPCPAGPSPCFCGFTNVFSLEYNFTPGTHEVKAVANDYPPFVAGACCTFTVSANAGTPPVPPSGASVNTPAFCSGSAPATITLTAAGGSGTTLRWFSGSCGGTSVGTGTPLTIPAPGSTTTYFARWETASCGNTTCANATATVVTSCDDGNPCTADSCTDGQCDHLPMDADSDGVVDCSDQCLNTPPSEPVNPQGCACTQLTCDDSDSCTENVCTAGVCSHPLIDADSDGVCDAADNCPGVANPDQANADSDGLGDLCDPCPNDALNDADGDGHCADVDSCPEVANADQADADSDGIGDACDSCTDTDGDGFGDPSHPANTCPPDNCPLVANPDQADGDSDGVGDACDTGSDTDGDGIEDAADNCPTIANADQTNADSDGFGDACDPCPQDPANDSDGDGHCADADNCPTVANTDQANADGDSRGDACDPCPLDPADDSDGDGHCADVDNCPELSNSDQADNDGDGLGDACDTTDDDGDFVPDGIRNGDDIPGFTACFNSGNPVGPCAAADIDDDGDLDAQDVRLFTCMLLELPSNCDP